MTKYEDKLLQFPDIVTYDIMFKRIYARILEVLTAIKIDGVEEEDKDKLEIISFNMLMDEREIQVFTVMPYEDGEEHKVITLPLEILMSYEMIPPYSVEGYNEQEWVKWYNEHKALFDSSIFLAPKPTILS